MVARIVGLMVALVCVACVSDVEAARHRRTVTVQRSQTQATCRNDSCSTSASSMSRTTTHGGNMQAWAEEEARLMAVRGTNGHVRSAPIGYFVGVGSNGHTCQGGGRLVAEATVHGKTVRVWAR